MKKTALFLFLLASLFLFSQNNRFEINAGPEFRITPIYKLSDLEATPPDVTTNADPHLSGTSVYYLINYKFRKINSSFGFGQSFRYDLLNYDNSIAIGTDYEQHNAVDRFMVDYHFIFTKYFDLRYDWKISAQIGVSFMDRNTDYGETVVRNYGTPYQYSYFHTMNYNFTGYAIGMGINRDKFGGNLGIYYTDNHHFTGVGEDNGIIIPYIKLQYNVANF